MSVLTVTSAPLIVTAAEIDAEHKAAQRCASEAVAHAIRAGELLLEVKTALRHGEFGTWLATNVEFSDRTARGYMRLAGLDEAERQRVAEMSLRVALRAIREAPLGAAAAQPSDEFTVAHAFPISGAATKPDRAPLTFDAEVMHVSDDASPTTSNVASPAVVLPIRPPSSSAGPPPASREAPKRAQPFAAAATAGASIALATDLFIRMIWRAVPAHARIALRAALIDLMDELLRKEAR